ncbi:hypothetical protein KIF53_20470 [Chromobacterium subtsugae]|uniref:Uncharacterized protein n=1 Tax=Chromobacterium subtsugae TaxID=251747 RepID=A0ABS7FIX1_9NEIS|nr:MULTISPECIES: hypothetical protein [Chromobacterium]MBW7568969.1 hypothetical protein [Chromobacterium subtsugae]MBW8290018.1 hypothetical protein [Chromobacterium subtsugae]WSE92971.1 hypothetical protein U6115_06940 [Chromobacterium subtsugae]WVH61349.1 hypothetical protein U6151_06960 [Chromobacterium subtsugae]
MKLKMHDTYTFKRCIVCTFLNFKYPAPRANRLAGSLSAQAALALACATPCGQVPDRGGRIEVIRTLGQVQPSQTNHASPKQQAGGQARRHGIEYLKENCKNPAICQPIAIAAAAAWRRGNF